jgi:site-specific recombinase XerD
VVDYDTSATPGQTRDQAVTDRGHRVLRVRRKGGKLQALALPAPAAGRIDTYLTARDDVTALPALPGSAGAARRRILFATGTGARMYRAEVRALLRRLGRGADLPEELTGSLSPHAMRHAFATLNLDAGASLRDLAGHPPPRTTRRYDRSSGNLDRSPGYLLAGYISRGR